MNLSVLTLSLPWLITVWCIALIVLSLTVHHIVRTQLHKRFPTAMWHGGILITTLLWSLQATIAGQFTFHLLGMAALALALGAPLALLASLVVVVLHALIHGGAWSNVPLVWLTLCVPAILVSTSVLRWAERRLPPHMFVYLLVVAFFGTGLSLLVSGLLSLLVFTMAGEMVLANAFEFFALAMILLSFGESTLTGMLITIGVVYYPKLITTFSDERYLKPH